MRKIILASTSPRRHELFTRFGIPFTVVASNYKEDMTLPLTPLKLAAHLAFGKAQAVAKRYPNAIIVAADTFIVYKNEVLGKPHTQARARTMLKKLSGKRHRVITGFAIIDTRTKRTVRKAAASDVYFKKLTSKEIDDYIASKEPLDKAGAYAIQGRGGFFIKKISGDYYNILGLPLYTLAKYLREFGITI